MDKSNQEPCQCEKASCACAGAKVEPCRCGDNCNCSGGCNCGKGCNCADAR